MKARILALVVAVCVSVASMLGAGPTISATPSSEDLVVRFDKGAVFACTVFKMVKPTETNLTQWPDGRYTPRHCWSLEESDTSYPDTWAWIERYDEDWEVYAEIGYPFPSEVAGVTDVKYLTTNTIKVHR